MVHCIPNNEQLMAPDAASYLIVVGDQLAGEATAAPTV